MKQMNYLSNTVYLGENAVVIYLDFEKYLTMYGIKTFITNV